MHEDGGHTRLESLYGKGLNIHPNSFGCDSVKTRLSCSALSCLVTTRTSHVIVIISNSRKKMSQDSQPPAKRQLRFEDASKIETLNHSDLYWFIDGNVVLQAEETLYRVHRFMFAHHSEVFKDMFSIPQPSVVTEVEECPVVPLTDKKEDIENLISLLYDNNK